MTMAHPTVGPALHSAVPNLKRTTLWLAAAAIAISGFLFSEPLKTYPDTWVVPFKGWFRSAMSFLTSDTPPVPGLPSIPTVTRSVAHVLDALLVLFQNLLSSGFGRPFGEAAVSIPAVPWYLVIATCCALGFRLEGWGLAGLTFIGLAFIAVTGNWDPAMITLSSVLVATALTTALGAFLGVFAYRSAAFDRLLSPLLDLMQTVPVFAYLVPVLMLLGFGPSAALAATVAYALPPMVRNTILGLRRVPKEVIEFGNLTGCTPLQLLCRIAIPSATPTIMVGVNQAVMMTLNMVIIASMIGAGGLGFNVLTALRRLDIGGGLEAGLAIVALAVILDRQSQAASRYARKHRPDEVPDSLLRGRIGVLIAVSLAAALYAAAVFVPGLDHYPQSLTFTAREPLNFAAKWLTVTLSTPLDHIKVWLLMNVMIPMRTYIAGLPWFALPLLAGLAGAVLEGWRLAALCAVLLTLVFAAGVQAPALLTVYLCGLGTLLALVVGVPLGVLGARSHWWHRVLGLACDTLQTLPSFIYLIPVVMLFKVGDFAALVAIVAYAVVPAIRYTDFGLRHVPEHLVEAGVMNGCTRMQLFWRIEVPLAIPEIILGVSQTIMMALSMLVITALVGTRDLGQETYIALAKADAGQGLVAGLAIAFFAITADRLLTAWSRKRTTQLGLH